MTFENVDITNLIKAFSKFQEFRQNLTTEQEKAGAIHAFNYCFELIWEIMRKVLENRDKTANSPKTVFRIAALEGLIDDLELWFDFLNMRNLIASAYYGKAAEKVVRIFPAYAEAMDEFLIKTNEPHRSSTI